MLWDVTIGTVLDGFIEWIYEKIVESLSVFLNMINVGSADIFDLSPIKAIVLFFSYFGWALFCVGFVVAIFEATIEMQNGKGSLQDVGLNLVKSLMAVPLFTKLPVELYKFSVTMQSSLSTGMAGLIGEDTTISDKTINIIRSIVLPESNLLLLIIFIILIGYSVIKVFFANLKRGGILLIMICVGSLYMFSLPRGYFDGFTSWCKQVVGLCLTAFLQTIILITGLMVFDNSLILGVGLMLSATEVPRIAQGFGLDSSTKGNLMGTVYATQSAVNLAKNVTQKAS